MSTTWFTSDLHLGHRMVADLRGFDNTADHDQSVLGGWDKTVGRNDIVYVLGDLCMGNPVQALAGLSDLPGRKRLVLGNHDKGHPLNSDAHAWTRRYLEVFEQVTAFARVRVLGVDALASHFPYTRDRGEMRHEQWRLPDLGQPLVHGHTHDTARRHVTSTGAVEIHVGLDAWGLRPVSDREIHALLTPTTDTQETRP